MAEADFNIDHVALHFDIHKTIVYRIINRLRKKVDWRPPEIGQTEKITNSTGGPFLSDPIKTGAISDSKSALYNI